MSPIPGHAKGVAWGKRGINPTAFVDFDRMLAMKPQTQWPFPSSNQGYQFVQGFYSKPTSCPVERSPFACVTISYSFSNSWCCFCWVMRSCSNMCALLQAHG